MDIKSELRRAKTPNGSWAVVAQYHDHKLSEYNDNPMIQALPPVLSYAEFVERVTKLPKFRPEERELEAHYRFHCIERLSRYFDPQNNSVELQKLVCVLLMEGYLGRNLLEPEYARRSHQIYDAIKAEDGKNLDDYVNVPTSASSLTLIGPSGIGKTTNLINILELYPQVIFHPEHSCYQLVWLKVDCPHAGSLKGLCTDIFLAADRLLGTNYFKKFGSRGNSEDYMLAQVAQLAHTQHLGVLVIDEMQNLVSARRGRDELLNFLVKMDNTIGIPVIRVGTNEAFPIFQGNFRNARRATGKAGVLWDRMHQFEEQNGVVVKGANGIPEDGGDWSYFIEGIWEYQWTKTFVPLNKGIKDVFYDECQGIIDIAIKLYKMVQWRAIALGGDEIITVDLIRHVAKEGLYLVKPMLDYVRNPQKEHWAIKFKDIAPIDTQEYSSKCLSKLESEQLEEVRQLARAQQTSSKYTSPTLRHIIIKLLDLEVEPETAKKCAEKVLDSNPETKDISALVKAAFALALQGESIETGKAEKSRGRTKTKSKYQENDIRGIVDNAKNNQTSAYEALKLARIVDNGLVEDFLGVG
ncbi:ATP-binding protein [Leptolyngbya sp. AN02str]|uniref:ATP-binding protein n=1 Tax=Leptolyngbya sp. AN02str TaxID=3423363 RepID=UPI003D31CBEA